jgi:hypothetical protein
VEVNDELARPEDVGAHYGFRRNPYDPTPLGIDPEDSALFVGRDEEGRAFRTFLRSSDQGGIFVEGGTGVGKTSFVHVQEYRCGLSGHGRRILPTLKPIQLASTAEPRVFLLSVLSNVLGSLGQAAPRTAKGPEYRRLTAAVSQSLIQTGGWDFQAASFGAGRTRDLVVSSPLLVLLSNISDLLDQAAKLAAAVGFERIVVNVNNLELLDAGTLTTFLDVTRDFTLTRRGFVWVYIGPIGVRATVAQRSRRVSELLQSDPIWLPPLGRADIHAAIDARVRRFRTAPSIRPPIRREVVDLLYTASSGELRYVLNRSKDLLSKTMVEFPTTREITIEVARPLLRRITASSLAQSNLTPKQLAVLERLVVRGASQPREFAEFGFRSAPAFLRYLLRFYKLQLVDRRRRGKEVVYTPRGDLVLALGPEGAHPGAPPPQGR